MTARNWASLKARMCQGDLAAGRLLLALDFDGTLADIAPTPRTAVLGDRTRMILERLVRRPDTRVAIISGRSIADLRDRAEIPGIYYSGNHGLEIEGPGIRWSHPQAQYLDLATTAALTEDTADLPGVLVERKQIGFAVHYRLAGERERAELRRRMFARLAELQSRYRLVHGKMVYDFRLDVSWGKAHALREIRRTLIGGWTSMFIGDDTTDEEAFAEIGPRALTVRVGRVRRSSAQYVVPSRRIVDELLDRLSRRAAGGPPPEAGAP